MRSTFFGAVLASTIFFSGSYASCAHGTSLHRRAEGEGPQFGYTGLQGPLNWAGLKAENSLCSTGTTQSPINIVGGNISMDAGSEYKVEIANTEGSEFENLGTTVEVLVNGTLNTAIKQYSMKQFHFHTPSEHHINGEYFPMESHFVFESEGMVFESLQVYLRH